MGKWKNSNKFDLFRYVNFKTVSAGFLGSLIAAWLVSPLFTLGLLFIGSLLLLGGEWYAREIYRKPMDETYWSVVWGWLLTGVPGITLVHIWINITGVSQWLHPFVWLWCVILTGGPQIAWQRRKRDEQVPKNDKAQNVLGDKLSKDNNG